MLYNVPKVGVLHCADTCITRSVAEHASRFSDAFHIYARMASFLSCHSCWLCISAFMYVHNSPGCDRHTTRKSWLMGPNMVGTTKVMGIQNFTV
mmetsp:Transcript_57889/g.95606  ORF Transcript_57889/g.95606 Transcript_57889/m.95606 type:complete len:94 (-) Transcript_57889:75-356(-)